MLITCDTSIGNYLGLPTQVGRHKRKDFNHFVEKIKTSLVDGRKSTCLKALIQVIPTYAISVFKFPHNLCDGINRLYPNYWRGAKEIFVGLSGIGKTKGIGFWKMTNFNDALLAKKMWRMIFHQDTLIHKCLKEKYFPNASILKEKFKHLDKLGAVEDSIN